MSRELVEYMNPARRARTGADWVALGVSLGLIVLFGGFLLAAWLAV